MWADVRADLAATVDADLVVGPAYWVKLVARALIAPQVHAVLLFRLSAALFASPLRPLAYIVRALTLGWSGAEIHPGASIGAGLGLMHSAGVVIGPGVRAGVDLRLGQGVTLGEPGRGGRKETWGFPTLGDHVTIGANAVVIGACHVGDGAVVGANTVITRDVDPNTVVVGSPPRVVRRLVPWEVDHTRSQDAE